MTTTPHAAAVRAAHKYFDPDGLWDGLRADDTAWKHNIGKSTEALAKLFTAEYSALVEAAEALVQYIEEHGSTNLKGVSVDFRAELARVKGEA